MKDEIKTRIQQMSGIICEMIDLVFQGFMENDMHIPILAGPYTDAKCTSRYSVVIGGKEFGKCILCRSACPERDIFFEPGTEIPLKCDLCGEPPDPACVKWCTSGALTFEEVDEEKKDETA